MNLKKGLLFFPIILVVIYFCAGIFYDAKNIIYWKPLLIPSFMIYAIVNNKKKLTLNYFLFVIFFYLGETLMLFWDNILFFRIALIASFFCYLSLVNLGYESIKNKNLYTIPKGFTLFILVLNALFLVAILYILISTIGDVYLNIILIFNAIVALILGATAVIYLGKITVRKSYYYFFGAFALILNDVFVAIVTYFMDNVVLNTFDRLLHFTSFLLIYLFIIEDKKSNKIDIIK